MPKKSIAKRSYNAESRRREAEKTKLEILKAAKKLFKAEGFDKITIAKIAKVAKISAPTIYAVFKSKRGIFLSLMDSALSKEKYAALLKKVEEKKSAPECLKLAARISRELYDAEKEELNLLRGAAILDPNLKELELIREHRRYERQQETVMIIAQEGAFKEDLSINEARDILWALTGRDLYRMLVLERHWPSVHYEEWLAQQLIQSLLK